MVCLPRLIAALGVVLAAGCIVQPPEDVPVRGSGTGGPPEPDLALGSPWTGWDDACTPATAFRRLAGWTTVTDPPGATCRIERATGPFTGGHPAARLTATSAVPVAAVELLPPGKIVLREPFDSLEMRVGSQPAAGAPEPRTGPPARIEVRIEDDRGAGLRVPLGAFPRDRWTIAHARIPAAFARTSHPPYRVVSFVVADWRAPEADALFLAGFSAYLEQGVPIAPEWRTPDWRARWEPPFRRIVRAARDGGATTGVASAAAPVRTRVETVAPGRYRLGATDDAGETAYTIEAADWLRGGGLEWNGRTCGRWSGWEIEAEGFDATPRLAAVVDDRIRIETAGGLSVCFRLDGRALCVSMEGGGGAIRAIRAGQLRSSSPLGSLRLPMLPGPRLLMWRCSDPVGTPVFATAGFDPAESGASRMEFGGEADADRPGGVVYEAATDGRRAPVREVFRLVLSARPGEVLPPVAPVAGRRAPDAAMALWMDVPAMGTGRLGEAWDAAGAGPLLLLPSGIRDESSSEDSIDCLDPRWSRDLVRRAPDGAWVAGDAEGRFAVKTTFLRALSGAGPGSGPAGVSVAVRARTTSLPPWAYTDFDARTRGAAGFRAAWGGLLEAMRGLSVRSGAPAVADGPWTWLYAGAADAYAVIPGGADDPREGGWLPFVPLLRLNPVVPGIGPPMPPPSQGGGEAGDADRRYLAAAFAHGLAPRLPALDAGDPRLWRIAFLSAALHRRQALGAVERIAYGDGRVLMSDADALSSGLWRRSMLYLRYRDGLEIWINGSDAPWEVRVGADLVTLPASGWHASGPGFACASATAGGRRIEYVRAPEYDYHDGGEGEAFAMDLACARPVVVRTDATGRGRVLSFWFPGEASRVGAGPRFLPPGSRVVRRAATAADGAPAVAPEIERDGTRAWLIPAPGTRRMELEWTN
ncbi:MAG: hypothetical protein FJ221_01050 [Lentisphaerae bacterium]|nr:hypothetical protein [Lentisphaerota bacterium]